MDLRVQVAPDLPLAAATPVRSEEGPRRLWKLWLRSEKTINSNFWSTCALRWRSSGSWWPRRRRSQPRLVQRHRQWTLISTRWSGSGRRRSTTYSKFEFEGESGEVKLSAKEKLLLREARKKKKLVWPWQYEQTARVAADFRRGSRKLPLTWSSSKNTDGRHRGHLSSGHEFVRTGGMLPTLSPALQSERSENASRGSTSVSCRAGINATDCRSSETLPWSGLRSTA